MCSNDNLFITQRLKVVQNCFNMYNIDRPQQSSFNCDLFFIF